jgi:hypothetical protein
MSASCKFFAGLAAALACGVLTSCGSTDLGFSGAKETLVGKPTPTPNLPDRPALVIPPPNAPLPVPGQTAQTAAAWRPATNDQPDKQAAQETDKSSGSSWYSGLLGSGELKKTQ